MPQVHSSAPISTENSVINSGPQKPEGIEAIFASILSEEQTINGVENEASLDATNQYIDELSRLIDEPIDEELSTSPEDLLQQIGHSVSFNAELNKAEGQKVRISGEMLPQADQKTNAKLVNTSESDVAKEMMPLQDAGTISPDSDATAQVNLTKSATYATSDVLNLSNEIHSKRVTDPIGITPVPGAEISNVQTPAVSNIISQNANPLSEIPESAKSLSTSVQLTMEGESLENDLTNQVPKSEIRPDLNPAKTSAHESVLVQKLADAPRPINSETGEVEDLSEKFLDEVADGLEVTEKNNSKSLSQLGQYSQLFAGNDRLEPAAATPRFNVSLKQGLEQQVQMQDMIQRFAPVMKQQIIAMVNNGLGQAEIRLDPPELGHMLVKIQVQQDQTHVQFQVSNPAARELLEQASPRLRDMLAEQGMNLADSEVSYHDGNRDQQGNQNGNGHSNFGEAGYSEQLNEAEEVTLLNIGSDQSSGIDYYA